MANLLDTGAAWLAQQREAHLSVLVEYLRPGVGSTELVAMRGRTEADVETPDGAVQTVRSVDWLLSPSALVLESEPTTPLAGDLVRETRAMEVLTYEVTPLGGQAAYRHAGGARETLRVHTRLVRTEPLGDA